MKLIISSKTHLVLGKSDIQVPENLLITKNSFDIRTQNSCKHLGIAVVGPSNLRSTPGVAKAVMIRTFQETFFERNYVLLEESLQLDGRKSDHIGQVFPLVNTTSSKSEHFREDFGLCSEACTRNQRGPNCKFKKNHAPILWFGSGSSNFSRWWINLSDCFEDTAIHVARQGGGIWHKTSVLGKINP